MFEEVYNFFLFCVFQRTLEKLKKGLNLRRSLTRARQKYSYI